MVDENVKADSDSSSEQPTHCPICQAAADKICSACHQVSYCSADHQKKHWKIHKNECRSFTVKRNNMYGRYIVATRDIPQGSIIFTEEPLVVGPKRSTLPVCLGCHLRVDGSYRCSKCTFPMCSEECEKAPIHAENECVIFQRGLPVGSKINNFDSICPAYECITPLRCILVKERNPSKWEKLITMEHHNELRKAVPALWNRNQVNVVKLLLDWYKMKDEVDEEVVHSVMGYIDVNSFEIKFRGAEMCGMYRDGALMCHDCVPNTHNAITTTEDHKMIVRSSVPIKKGEMITTSYVNQLNGTRERRWYLKDTKYFDCLCRRCNDPTEFATYVSGIKCTECASGYLLPKDPVSLDSTEWICTNSKEGTEAINNKNSNVNSNINCSKVMKEDQIETLLRKARKDIDEVSRSTAGSPISRFERLMKKYSGKILHPNHYLLTNVIKSLNYSYATLHKTHDSENTELDMDLLNRSKSLCLQLLSVLDMLDPGLSRLRGVTLFQLSISDFHIARLRYEKKETKKDEYKESLEKNLAYLQTSKEILELDTLVTPTPLLYNETTKHMDVLQNILATL